MAKYTLIDDPICDVEEWESSYEDCRECPCFEECMMEDEE